VLDWYVLDGNQTAICDAANADAHLFNPFAVDTQTGVIEADCCQPAILMQSQYASECSRESWHLCAVGDVQRKTIILSSSGKYTFTIPLLPLKHSFSGA
jgi:hypothetical protein